MKVAKILLIEDNPGDLDLFLIYFNELDNAGVVDTTVRAVSCLSELSIDELGDYDIVVSDLNLVKYQEEDTKEFWAKNKPEGCVLIGFSGNKQDAAPPFDYFINKADGCSLLMKLLGMQSKLL